MSVLQKRFLSSQTKITYPPTESREKPVNGSIIKKKQNKESSQLATARKNRADTIPGGS